MNDNPNCMSVEQIYAAQQEIISFMKENRLDTAKKKLHELATVLRAEYHNNPSDFVRTSIVWIGATDRDLAELTEKQRVLHIQRTNAAIDARHMAKNIEKHLHSPSRFHIPFIAVMLLGASISLVLIQLYCEYFTPCFITTPSWVITLSENPTISVVIQAVTAFVQAHPDIFPHTLICEAMSTHITMYALIGVCLSLVILMVMAKGVLHAVRMIIYQIGMNRYKYWMKKANQL